MSCNALSAALETTSARWCFGEATCHSGIGQGDDLGSADSFLPAIWPCVIPAIKFAFGFEPARLPQA